MQGCDLILQNAVLPGGMRADLALSGGRIAHMKPADAENPSPDGATQRIDLNGRFVSPSFVDAHVHLDKAFSNTEGDADGLIEAIAAFSRYQSGIPRERAAEDILRRGAMVLAREAASGSCAVKTHVSIGSRWGMDTLSATLALKERFSGVIDLLCSVPWEEPFDGEWRGAARRGEIDFIAGYPGLGDADDFAQEVDRLFSLAEEYGLPLDLHVNESDAGDVRCFAYILQKTLESGMRGLVSCSHVTALNAAPDAHAAELIARAAEAGVNVITLPSCNMYLMGRSDRQPVRRGVTRVDEFLRAGVNTAYASDNIRDPFRPFGNGDMLEEGLFTAQVIQYATREKLRAVWRMGTENAAKASLLRDYGLFAGARADLTVFDAKDEADALLSQAARTLVFKGGRVVAENGRLKDPALEALRDAAAFGGE